MPLNLFTEKLTGSTNPTNLPRLHNPSPINIPFYECMISCGLFYIINHTLIDECSLMTRYLSVYLSSVYCRSRILL
jgi:hypothetical protein